MPFTSPITLSGVNLGRFDAELDYLYDPSISGYRAITPNDLSSAVSPDNSVSSGNPSYVGGLAVTGSNYSPAYSAGDRAVFAFDKDNGGLLVNNRLSTVDDSIASASFGHSFVNITTASTGNYKAGSGVLHVVVVNSGAGGAITLYDNISGTAGKIATLKSTISEGTYTYNCRFISGLSVANSVASDITVVFR